MNEEQKTIEPKIEEVKKEEVKPTEPKWREILIKTNGTDINIVRADVAGNLEFVAILQSLIGALTQKK